MSLKITYFGHLLVGLLLWIKMLYSFKSYVTGINVALISSLTWSLQPNLHVFEDLHIFRDPLLVVVTNFRTLQLQLSDMNIRFIYGEIIGSFVAFLWSIMWLILSLRIFPTFVYHYLILTEPKTPLRSSLSLPFLIK